MIKWKLPSPDEPGFLRRRLDLSALLDAEPTPENQEAVIEFLIPFVDAPKKEARERLLDASKAEYGVAILNLLGLGNIVTPPKDGSSGPA